MRFRGLDLNLLVAFDALMETRSVSQAALRLNLSQPAMSAALSRLRDYFGDPLLAAFGKRMHPTSHAEALWPQVRACLRQLDQVIGTSAQFDPATSRRMFRVATSDYLTSVVLAPMLADIAGTAPGIGLDIQSTGDSTHDQLDNGKLDLAIMPEGYAHPDHPLELLLEEEHVVVGWRGNPLLAGPISKADFLAAAHVVVSMGMERTLAFGDRHLDTMGLARRIEVQAPSFNSVPILLEGTRRLALMHRRLAIRMQAHFPLAVQKPPFPMPRMRQMLQFHRARSGDEGLRWLRAALHRTANQSPLPMDCNP